MARAEASYTPSGTKGLEVGRTSPVRRLLGPDWRLGWLLVGPVFLIIAALLIYPFFDAIVLSFQDRFIGKSGHWIGVQNYTDLIRNPNTHFLEGGMEHVRHHRRGDGRQVLHRHGDGLRAQPADPRARISGAA